MALSDRQKRAAKSTARESEALYANIAKAIRELKRDGVASMTLANLYQITPTAGVNVPVARFRPLFDRYAVEAARELGFGILD